MGIAIAGGYGYLAQQGLEFAIVDLSQLDTVRQIGGCGHSGFSANVALYSHYAYLAEEDMAGESGVDVVDVANPNSPHLVGACATGSTRGIAVQGSYAYAASDSGLYVLDLTNPQSPAIVGLCRGMGTQYNVAVRDSFAYVVGNGFHVVDICNPAAPTQIGSLTLPDVGYDVALWGDLAYVAASTGGLRVINISNPAAPAEYGYYDSGQSAMGVAANQNIVYLADGGCFGTYEVLGVHGVTVTSPNGGEHCGSLCTDTITWTSAGVEGNVNILLNRSYPGGVWQPLFTDIANSGHVVWNVTGPHSYECRIKIVSMSDTSLFDVSDGNFAINRGQIVLHPHTLAFGGVPVDTSAMQQFWVRNTGADTLQMDSIISSDPAFTSLNDWLFVIRPGDSLAIGVLFAPRDTLHHTGVITIYSSAGDSTVACTGFGMLPNRVIARGNTPVEYRLYPAYPNPFNVRATISYDLPNSGHVSLRVFDMLGRTALVLKEGYVEAGNHRVTIDGTNLGSGIYFARLDAGKYTQTVKLVLLK